MSVDRDEVRRIAELAKLDLDDEGADRLAGEMNRILAYAERLGGLDADEGTTAAATPVTVAARSEMVVATPGAIDEAAGPDALLRPPDAFAPEMIEGFFAVPPPPGVVADAYDADAATEAEAEASDDGRAEDAAG